MSMIRGPLGSTVTSTQGEKSDPSAKPPPPASRFTRGAYNRDPALPPKPGKDLGQDNKAVNGDSIYEKTYSSRYGTGGGGSSYSERYSTLSATSVSTSDSGSTKPVPPAPISSKRETFFKGEQTSYTPKFDPHAFKEKPVSSTVSSSAAINTGQEKEDYSSKSDRVKKEPIEIDGYVGFANLPNQVYRKSVKKGFEFSLMVVGGSGLGKSTLVNSLFLTDIYNAEHPGPSHRIKKTSSPPHTEWIVETNQVLVKENGVQLKLTVVDTPGFGDAVDNSNCWDPVIDYINSKFEDYLNAESRVVRKHHADSRVHGCLYFIAPSGHGLKPLDIEFMKRLHDKVNIIPVVAKADCMLPDEVREFKKTILNEIAQHEIKIYEFPDLTDEDEAKTNKRMKERVPFAVVGSNAIVNVGGQQARGRVYPWGTVEVENLEHNDFIALRNMVLRTHMQDLKDVTNNVHYENFRYNKLSNAVKDDDNVKSNQTTKSPLLQMEEEKKEHGAKLKKMEAEMEQVFEMKVKEKKQKLKDSEGDLQRRAEQMKKSLEQQERELEEKRKQLEKEKLVWEESMRLDERRRSLENSKDSIDGHKKDKKEKKKGLF